MNLVGGGYRYTLCRLYHSSDRERLVYWYVVNKTYILLRSQKIIKLLHIAPEKNLQKVLKASTKINYISGDLNFLVADRKIDITDINFEDNYYNYPILQKAYHKIKGR